MLSLFSFFTYLFSKRIAFSMKIRFTILLYGTTLCFFLACNNEPKVQEEYSAPPKIEMEIAKEQTYEELKKETIARRDEYYELFKTSSKNKAKQDSILHDAQDFLVQQTSKYFLAWHGTQWDFNGHTETPRHGKIACGYFIITTLRDMGFRIPRIKWSQQHAEYVINKLSKDIKRFHSVPIEDIINYIDEKGEGLYIVGLDSHVGFIYNHNGWMRFVHSNYYYPKIGVMSENMVGKNPLNTSTLRVIGKIFDEKMTRNWILNSSYYD